MQCLSKSAKENQEAVGSLRFAWKMTSGAVDESDGNFAFSLEQQMALWHFQERSKLCSDNSVTYCSVLYNLR